MTHIEWPTEVGPPLSSNHWYTEAMRQSAKVRQQSERTSTAEARATQLELERDALLRVVTDNHVALQRAEAAEAKLAKAIEGLRFYAEQADYEQQIIVRDCECCSYLEDPIILDDKGNLARRVLEKLVGK